MRIDSVAILDCGGQYTKVIDRKIREMGVRSEILPINVKPSDLSPYQGLILSGGPGSVWNAERLPYDPALFDTGLPVLGICYGMQLINAHFGGVVGASGTGEYGETVIDIDTKCPLFKGLSPKERVLMSHGDSIQQLAPGFAIAGRSKDVIAALFDRERRIYGVQFHPEVDLTTHGKAMLSNFLFEICGLKGNYVLEDRIDTAIQKIREQVGLQKIIVLVSGGVDSAVSAALLLKALDVDQVYAVHVDHGLMRKNESALICENLRALGLKHLIHYQGEKSFFNEVTVVDGKPLGPLTSLDDPEDKRRLIGDVFVKVVRDVCTSLELDFDRTFWAQGTLRPDLIESGNPLVSSFAHKIKTHHNDVDLVRRAREAGLVVETNWDWHKDEVRQVARLLGIDEAIASRQPFPGPGLAVRMMCTKATETVDASEQQEAQRLAHEWSPHFKAEVVPLRTVGVQGDYRSYRYLTILGNEQLSPNDASQWPELFDLGRELPNRLKFVNRVAYALNKPTWDRPLVVHPMHIDHAHVALLQDIDALVTSRLDNGKISQFFAVLLPVGFSKTSYSVAIRTIVTSDFMTGRPASVGDSTQEIRHADLLQLADEIATQFKQIDLVLYDITSKPPATVEWQ